MKNVSTVKHTKIYLNSVHGRSYDLGLVRKAVHSPSDKRGRGETDSEYQTLEHED